MVRTRLVAKVCAVAGAIACAGVLASATDANAVVVRTKISLAEFKAANNLSSVRRVFDRSNGLGSNMYIQRFNTEGKSFRKFGGTVDLTKSFIFFRVNTPPQTDPVVLAFAVRVQPGPFSANNDPVILTCTGSGSTAGGIGSLSCNGGPGVSPA
jgi:hypothetical protein